MIRVFAALCAAIFAGFPAAAAEPQTGPTGVAAPAQSQTEAATAFAKQMLADATAALTKPNTTEAQRLAAFQEVLKKSLALDVIGKQVLGESNRKKMSAAQVARYDAAFPHYITRQYAEQFKDLIGRPMEVTRAVPVPRQPNDTIVRAQIQRKNGTPINVDWRVRNLKSGSKKMVDIIVGGVSIMTVKREEFSSYIKANGVDALLTRIEAEARGA